MPCGHTERAYAGDVGLYPYTVGERVSGESPLDTRKPIREGRRTFRVPMVFLFYLSSEALKT